MKNLEENMVSENTFTVLVPLDEVFSEHMPIERDKVYVLLNGLVSPYSIALAILDLRLKTGTNCYDKLCQSLEWLPNGVERSIVARYIHTLTDTLGYYVLPLLAQEFLTLDNIVLKSTFENTLDPWRCGYVTLTFNIHGPRAASGFIGTPYPAPYHHPPVPVPVEPVYQVPNHSNGYSG